MKRLVSLTIMVMSFALITGCAYLPSTINTDNAVYYAESTYKIPNSYVMGDPGIVFAVGYVSYDRPNTVVLDNKYPVGRKRTTVPFEDYGATVYMRNLPETIKMLTLAVARNTGWGTTHLEDNADFIITEKIKDFYMYGGYNGFTKEFIGKGPVKNEPYIDIILTVEDQTGKVVFKKDLRWTEYASEFSPLAENGADGGSLIPENMAYFFYKSMVRLFSSREFIKTIEKHADKMPSKDQIIINNVWE